jgi:N-carbamoyl-L-amino-acid hydrolase
VRSSRRLIEDLVQLARFGATAEGAVMRVAYSDADLRARDWLDSEFAGLGMSVRRDAAGSSIAVLPGSEPKLDPIAVVSHTDSVPDGGRYDGALGVIAGLACARAVHAGAPRLRHPLAVVNFEAEEATMAGATFGSRAFVGSLDPAIVERPAFDGRPVRTHLEAAALDPDAVTDAARGRERFAACLELHVEQGPVLDAEGVTIGVVEGIVGIRRYVATFTGTANHAGTTPMDARDDALVSAAPFVVAVRDVAVARGIAGTVGSLRVSPGAPNVIPGRVEVDVELRSTDDSLLARAEEELRGIAGAAGATLDPLTAKTPVAFSPRVLERIEDAARELGLSHRRLWSGAGHDAGLLAPLTEAGMIFVPSRGGMSHSVDELTEDADCVAGAEVLLRTIVALDAELG